MRCFGRKNRTDAPLIKSIRCGLTAWLLLANGLFAQPTLRISPERPEPGSIVVLTLENPGPSDSAATITGRMAEEALHFRQVRHGIWRAIGAVPVDAAGSVVATAILYRGPIADSVSASVPVPEVRAATSRLSVSTQYTRPLDKATAARVARENARAREIGRRSHETPRLWLEPFQPPRNSELTSRFGSGRLFNGRVTSRHLGTDFRGAVGDTVRVANRGVVALVDTFFLAGTVLYVDHGEGIVTGYFHLSKPLVSIGDTVSRGDVIALVGESGRVTGPHLHWAARYGRIAVNPMDLLTLEERPASTSDPLPPRTPASFSPARR
jgi:murein DD-endopeptidase MepM/ murein hydrolase activator NlpD